MENIAFLAWVQFGIILVTLAGLFIWNRTESRADMRHMDTKLESNRNLSIEIHRENLQIIQSIKEENRVIIEQTKAESRASIEQTKAENRASIEQTKEETKVILMAIQAEIKDFHGRMCAIEERARKI